MRSPDNPTETRDTPTPRSNFIRDIIDADLASGKYKKIVTRFPPEPNGYPHIGHAKAICLNFGLAIDYKGVYHLRFDDTNPAKEEVEYVEAIQRDIKWLGFDWGDKLFFASDYFEKFYEVALYLIKKGKAYVDSLSVEEIREFRGSLTEPGKESPHRGRSAEESLDLFVRMRAGEFPDGAHVLRAKIDMSAKNMLMRDPILYRIRHAHHYRTGDAWCIYPLYDYAHPLSDAIERITHSICSLEFETRRELYDWLIEEAHELLPARPRQYEFARLHLAHTMMSKRNLLKLVQEGVVSGWDDPRMPTLSGYRRRGVTPEAIKEFCEMIGVAKANSLVDYEKLEYCIRNDLNFRAPRRMCVLDPLRVEIINYPEGEEEVEAADFPPDVGKPGARKIPFSRVLYIERSDFAENPPKGFHRLSPGKEVRLAFAYIIKCEEVIKDEEGKITALRCSYDPESRSGQSTRKVKGTIHWVSAEHALPCELRLYEHLFLAERPGEEHDFHEDLNPNSLSVIEGAYIEPTVASDPTPSFYQFTRQGYFCSDSVDSRPGHLVFNRTVTLRDSWAKQAAPPKEAEAKPEVKPETRAEAPPGERVRPNKKTRTQARAEMRAQNPALAARFTRYQSALGLSEEDAEVLSGAQEISDFFEETLLAYDNAQSVAKWVSNELLRELKDRDLKTLPVKPAQLAALARLVDEETISASAGKAVFAKMMEEGGEPAEIVEREGLKKVADAGALGAVVEKVLAENPSQVKSYQGGKTALLGFFVGQVMRETKGSADPALTRELLTKKLG